MKKLNKIGYLILLVSICFSCGNKSKTAESNIKEDKAVQQPNIVFILSDDQSWTDYGFMGNENIELHV